MTLREDIVTEARSFIGTPFVHQGRLKGVGVDCVGLLIEVARAFGHTYNAPADYAMQPDPHAMRTLLDANLDRVLLTKIMIADILWFRVDTNPQHLGIVSNLAPFSVVHALNRVGGGECCEHRVSTKWQRRIQACFRYRWTA